MHNADANETNGLDNPRAYHADHHARLRAEGGTVPWTAPGLRITRLRMLTEPGHPMLDVSYCHGEIDGATVWVQLPFDQLPRRGATRALVEHAKRDGVHAKRIGALDAISILF